jgi:glycosyltransferase involved in cell wall biosynthesis
MDFMAEPKNWRELAKKLNRLIENQRLRKQLGEWGLGEAKKYSWPVIAGRVLQFYEKCSNVSR